VKGDACYGLSMGLEDIAGRRFGEPVRWVLVAARQRQGRCILELSLESGISRFEVENLWTGSVRGLRGALCGLLAPGRTFFCKRTTLVHFFSSNPSYFFDFSLSKMSSPIPSSPRKVAAVWVKFCEER